MTRPGQPQDLIPWFLESQSWKPVHVGQQSVTLPDTQSPPEVQENEDKPRHREQAAERPHGDQIPDSFLAFVSTQESSY